MRRFADPYERWRLGIKSPFKTCHLFSSRRAKFISFSWFLVVAEGLNAVAPLFHGSSPKHPSSESTSLLILNRNSSVKESGIFRCLIFRISYDHKGPIKALESSNQTRLHAEHPMLVCLLGYRKCLGLIVMIVLRD